MQYLKFRLLPQDSNPEPIKSSMKNQPFSQSGKISPNGRVFNYELSCCGFESSCSQLEETTLDFPQGTVQ